MTSVRKRHRKTAAKQVVQNAPAGANTKGRPGDATPGNDSDSCITDAGDSDPDITKLRTLLLMRAQGKTQPEIAAHFGKDVRTIRRWEAKARRLKLALAQDLNPREALADFIYSLAEMKADLMYMKESAKEAEDPRLYLRCIKELVRLEATRMAVLERIGLFDGYAFARAEPDDPSVCGARLVSSAARDVIDGDFERIEPANDEPRTEDDKETLF